MPDLTITHISAEDTIPLRHLVLWPSIPPESQLFDYDHAPGTIHLGAFPKPTNPTPTTLPAPTDSSPTEGPIAILTLVPTPFPRPLPPNPPFTPPPTLQIQLRKFAVHPSQQGTGIGRQLLARAVDECTRLGGGHPVLLHLDARENQVGFYARLGLEVLDPEVFGKRGAGGMGPEIPHVRMGRVV